MEIKLRLLLKSITTTKIVLLKKKDLRFQERFKLHLLNMNSNMSNQSSSPNNLSCYLQYMYTCCSILLLDVNYVFISMYLYDKVLRTQLMLSALK